MSSHELACVWECLPRQAGRHELACVQKCLQGGQIVTSKHPGLPLQISLSDRRNGRDKLSLAVLTRLAYQINITACSDLFEAVRASDRLCAAFMTSSFDQSTPAVGTSPHSATMNKHWSLLKEITSCVLTGSQGITQCTHGIHM